MEQKDSFYVYDTLFLCPVDKNDVYGDFHSRGRGEPICIDFKNIVYFISDASNY